LGFFVAFGFMVVSGFAACGCQRALCGVMKHASRRQKVRSVVKDHKKRKRGLILGSRFSRYPLVLSPFHILQLLILDAMIATRHKTIDLSKTVGDNRPWRRPFQLTRVPVLAKKEATCFDFLKTKLRHFFETAFSWSITY
jgi:hypothetical protein